MSSASAWTDECFRIFIDNCTISFLDIYTLQQKQCRDISVFTRPKDFETCYYFTFSCLHIYNLKFISNSLSNILLYYGDLIERGPDRDDYYFTALISIPTQNILIQIQGLKKHRQIMRFINQMNDVLRTSVLLKIKQFALGEDINFD
jgi:hypothetical protein